MANILYRNTLGNALFLTLDAWPWLAYTIRTQFPSTDAFWVPLWPSAPEMTVRRWVVG